MQKVREVAAAREVQTSLRTEIESYKALIECQEKKYVNSYIMSSLLLYINIFSYELHCTVRMMLLNDVCFVLHVRCDPSYSFFLSSFVLILLYKIGRQFNECLLLWQPFGMFLYSTVIVCFILNKI